MVDDVKHDVVGIVGLGALGVPVARNVIGSGIETWVYDVRDDAVQGLVPIGGRPARSVSELAIRSTIVLIAVATAEQVDAVLFGAPSAPGLVGSARSDSVVVIHATIGGEACREIQARAAKHGIEVVDAPVSGRDGAPASAARQEMTCLVGGKPEVLARVRPVLELSGRTLHHVGDVGDAQDVKLAINALTLVQMQATHETMRLLGAMKLDVARATAILSETSASNWAVDHWTTIMEAATAQPGADSIPRKDLALAIRTAERHGFPLDLAVRVLELLSVPARGFLARRSSNPTGAPTSSSAAR